MTPLPMLKGCEVITNEMIEAGIAAWESDPDEGWADESDMIVAIYTAMSASRATDPAKLEMLVEALKGIKARHGWCAHPCKACEAADAALKGAAQ